MSFHVKTSYGDSKTSYLHIVRPAKPLATITRMGSRPTFPNVYEWRRRKPIVVSHGGPHASPRWVAVS